MHLFTPTEELTWQGVSLTPDNEYLCEDVTAGELLSLGYGQARSALPLSGSSHADSLLVVRPGGFGDLLFLTPILELLHYTYPDMTLGVACYERYRPVLAALSYLEPVPYPVESRKASTYQTLVWLENCIESDPLAHERHIIDQFASRFPMKLDVSDKTLRYEVTAAEKAFTSVRYPRTKRKRMAVQVSASARIRTYPQEQMAMVLALLNAEGIEVVLLGHPGEIPGRRPGVLNLTQETPEIGFRESAAIMSQCDALIAPDSAMTHVAAAIGLPCVALYGPFPWKLRTEPYPSTRALQGHAPCAPCFHHFRRTQFPEGMPCAKSGWCVAMESIAPERVVREVLKMIEVPAPLRRAFDEAESGDVIPFPS